jgi:hypothetical protein
MNKEDEAVEDEARRDSVAKWRRGLEYEEYWDAMCSETNKCSFLVQSENVERLLEQEYSKSQLLRNRI